MTVGPTPTTVPAVAIDPACKKTTGLLALQGLLQKAAQDLASRNAWKPELGDIEILIFKAGTGEGKDLAAGIWTDIEPDPSAAPNRPAQRDPTKNIRILVDEAFFQNGMGKKMVDRGESPEDTAFWCLAHESFHIDEYERMSASGILMQSRFTSFAGAVRPEFTQPWKDAWQALTHRYPATKDLPADLQVAGEIANEASADMTAMRYFKDSSRDWKRFAANLATLREEDDAAWQKDQSSFLSKFKREKSPPYRTAKQIKAFIKAESDDLPDLLEIYAQCWRMALAMILASGGLDWRVRAALRAAESHPPIATNPPVAPSAATMAPPHSSP